MFQDPGLLSLFSSEEPQDFVSPLPWDTVQGPSLLAWPDTATLGLSSTNPNALKSPAEMPGQGTADRAYSRAVAAQ